MKYYIRYLKFTKISVDSTKPYPLDKLAVNWTGDEFEQLDLNTTYNGMSANEHFNTTFGSKYKYQDKYIETLNVTKIPIEEFKERSKKTGTIYSWGGVTYEHNCGSVRMYYDDPDPFDFHEPRTNNRYDVITDTKHIYKHEIYIGLYKYNDLQEKYEFILYSLYDKDSSIYYVV